MSDVFWTGLFTASSGLGGAVVTALIQSRSQKRQIMADSDKDQAQRADNRRIDRNEYERKAILDALALPLDSLSAGQERQEMPKLRNLVVQVDDEVLHEIAESWERIWEVRPRLGYVLRTDKAVRTPEGHLTAIQRAKAARQASDARREADRRIIEQLGDDPPEFALEE